MENYEEPCKRGKIRHFISHKFERNHERFDAARFCAEETDWNVETRKHQFRTLADDGRPDIQFKWDRKARTTRRGGLEVENLTVVSPYSQKNVVNDVSFKVRKGEIVCLAGIEGNGQSEIIYAISGMMKAASGRIVLNGEDITHRNIRYRNDHGISHVPEDRQKYGLILDYNLAYNLALKQYHLPRFRNLGS